MKRSTSNREQTGMALAQLGVMLDAGITHEAALLNLVKSAKLPLSRHFSQAARMVAKGHLLSRALARVEVLNSADVAWLAAAEQAGRPERALKAIAERMLAGINHLRALKTGLLFPQLVLLIGMLAALFIKIAQGGHVADALMSVVVPTLSVFFAFKFFLSLLGLDARKWLAWFWSFPIVSRCIKYHILATQRQFELAFYTPLLWQLDAGISPTDALINNRKVLANKMFKAQVIEASELTGRGQPLSKALSNNGLILSQRMRQLIALAQTSGEFERALRSELALLRDQEKQFLKNAVSWLPKLAYVIVIVVVVSMFA